MPIDPPAGYLTRPKAAKKYNRSQRALERDLDVALTVQDEELLSHWKLVTNDGTVRDGGEVTIEQVKRLVADGKTPAWCVAESFLEEKYGRKGEPRPRPSAEEVTDSTSINERVEKRGKNQSSNPSERLLDDATFLKNLIRTLEREKEQERERHDRIVAKLFEQLAVKDRQISAWDEVTQGLTKALATGQIAPNQRFLLADAQNRNDKASEPRNASHAAKTGRTEAVADAGPTTSQSAAKHSNDSTKKRTRTKKKSARTATGKKTTAEKPSAKKQSTTKPKWYETPTLKRLLSRSG